jgi:glycosyltransferase involved in cell wall biosynthesis
MQEHSIEWWGHREDLPTVIGQATVVVLPSYREGLPKVLLEAAACGKAVIATNVPGCRSVVEHRKTGLLVPVRDAIALAEAMAELLGNAEQRAVLGANARQFVVREHSSGTISAAFLSLYRELLGQTAISQVV